MTIIYVTKYALTTGIRRVDAEPIRNNAFRYRPKGWTISNYAYGEEFQMTEAAAIERAEILREKKIKSLEKQIAKLRAIKFEVKDV